jgi:hypothetical protein
MGKANLIGIALLPLWVAGIFVPYVLLWGLPALAHGFYHGLLTLVSIPVFIVLVFLHERLHGAGYRLFGEVEKQEIMFGMNWRSFSPYIHCLVPVTAAQYRMAVALPGLLLGVMPAVAGIVSGAGWLCFWGFLMTVAAGGDAAVLWAIRNVGADVLVRDHPTRAGCEILQD